MSKEHRDLVFTSTDGFEYFVWESDSGLFYIIQKDKILNCFWESFFKCDDFNIIRKSEAQTILRKFAKNKNLTCTIDLTQEPTNSELLNLIARNIHCIERQQDIIQSMKEDLANLQRIMGIEK